MKVLGNDLVSTEEFTEFKNELDNKLNNYKISIAVLSIIVLSLVSYVIIIL